MKSLFSTEIDSKMPFNGFCDFFSKSCFLLSTNRMSHKDTPLIARIYGSEFKDLSMFNWSYASLDPLDSLEFFRTNSHLALDSIDNYTLILNGGTDAHFSQYGKNTIIPNNSFHLYRSMPFNVQMPSHSDAFFITIPNKHLESLLRDPDLANPSLISINQSIGRILSRYCRELIVLAKNPSSSESNVVYEHILSLVAKIFGPSPDGLEKYSYQASEILYRNVLVYLNENFRDPDLSAERVANRFHISKYKLSRILSGHGSSFYELVKIKRIDCCARDLSSQRLNNLSISSIAYKNGFNNVSHFSRCFRERFGCTPKEYRLLHDNDPNKRTIVHN